MALPGGPRLVASSLALVALLACGEDEKPKGPCSGVSGTCVAFEASESATSIRDRMAGASAGTTFAFGAGTFALDLPLEVTAADVTIKGAGRDATVLDFAGQTGAEGVFASGDGFTLRDLAIRDTAGNGVKIVGADDVWVKNVKVTWTAADATTHGGYGIYPVQSTRVLVEDCFTSGATDTGIYVGQSADIVVRNNEATGNVAGVEIENSYRADVHGNTLHGNTGGVLVFDLPGLQQQGGNHVRVFDNVITSNNTENFGPAGSTVALVPAGTGIAVMANHDVEIFRNTISGNGTVAVGIISYVVTGLEVPGGYDPFPNGVHVHDNTITGNGTSPDQDVDLGALLAFVSATALGGSPVPDVVWDGLSAPGAAANPNGICVKTGASWLSLGATLGENGIAWNPSVDDADFRCARDPLPAVTAW